MATLPLKIYPDKILRENCEPVIDFDEQLGKFLDDMAETMYAENGIGLAAPQVGVTRRIAVIDVSSDRGELLELINPEIVESSGTVSSEEGCLSIPEYRETVKRHATVRVRAKNRAGEEFEIDAEDLLAICLQHELDHLDGVLFVDHLSRLKREMFKRWYRKRVAAS